MRSGKPAQSSFSARFNRACRVDVLDLYVFARLSAVREITEDWIRANGHRMHSDT